MTDRPVAGTEALGMKLLGVDYGEKRVGLALTDDLGLLAHARGSVPREGAADEIEDLAREEGARTAVVGLPLNMDGTEGQSARHARGFAEELKKRGLAVTLFDERLTTVQARSLLREAGVNSRRAKDVLDGASAQLLLQAYVDLKKREGS